MNGSSLTRAVVLAEGVSDQRALMTLAERRGRDLEAEGVSVVPIGGAHAIGPYLERFGPRGRDLTLAGLCDVGEESAFRRALTRAGMGTNLTCGDMEDLGFYVWSEEERLWRFMWNRKIRYARLLVDALDLSRVPRPLDGVLARV